LTVEQALEIPCGGERLVGILHPGAADAAVGVVIVVGGPQYRVGSHRQFVIMARQLAASGVPVLRFDYRGMGDSTGIPRSFESVDEDIRAAIDCLFDSQPAVRTAVLLGLCDAASANLLYAGNDIRLGGLILINPWVRSSRGEAQAYLRYYYVRRLLQRSFWRKVASGQLKLSRSVRELFGTVSRARQEDEPEGASGSFVDRMRVGLENFPGSVLFLISDNDLTAREFLDLCSEDRDWKRAMSRSTVTSQTLANADHTMSRRADLLRAGDACIDWLAGFSG